MTFVNARSLCLSVLALWALTSPAVSAQQGPQPRLDTVQLTVGMHVIKAELAVTPTQQAVGMMMRTEMGANEGMLFVNSDSSRRCFWMRNTLLPLSIAFISEDGSIVNIVEMQPRSEESHCSTHPVRYALEMNKGWFAKRGLQAGSKLRGGPFGK